MLYQCVKICVQFRPDYECDTTDRDTTDEMALKKILLVSMVRFEKKLKVIFQLFLDALLLMHSTYTINCF